MEIFSFPSSIVAKGSIFVGAWHSPVIDHMDRSRFPHVGHLCARTHMLGSYSTSIHVTVLARASRGGGGSPVSPGGLKPHQYCPPSRVSFRRGGGERSSRVSDQPRQWLPHVMVSQLTSIAPPAPRPPAPVSPHSPSPDRATSQPPTIQRVIELTMPPPMSRS